MGDPYKMKILIFSIPQYCSIVNIKNNVSQINGLPGTMSTIYQVLILHFLEVP